MICRSDSLMNSEHSTDQQVNRFRKCVTSGLARIPARRVGCGALQSGLFILETAVETHIQAQGTESKDFSTAPQFTKTVNSSMASHG